MVVSNFWTDAELQKLAESEFRQFYVQAASRYPDFFTSSTIYNTTAGAEEVTLSTPYIWKLRGVRHMKNNNPDFFLRKIDLHEQMKIAGVNYRAKPGYYEWIFDPVLEYTKLRLRPVPDIIYPLLVHYIPIYSLQNINSGLGAEKTLHQLAPWDEYLVLKIAIAMKDREESDCSVLMASASDCMSIMERTMSPIDAGEPDSMVQYGDRDRSLSIMDDPYLLIEPYL
jgi:hypothetical protein